MFMQLDGFCVRHGGKRQWYARTLASVSMLGSSKWGPRAVRNKVLAALSCIQPVIPPPPGQTIAPNQWGGLQQPDPTPVEISLLL